MISANIGYIERICSITEVAEPLAVGALFSSSCTQLRCRCRGELWRSTSREMRLVERAFALACSADPGSGVGVCGFAIGVRRRGLSSILERTQSILHSFANMAR
jgi:hypothetical protein